MSAFRSHVGFLVLSLVAGSGGVMEAQSLGAAVDGVCYEGSCTPAPLPIAGSELLTLSFTYTLPNGDIYFVNGPFSGSSDSLGTTLYENDIYQVTYEGNTSGPTLPSGADTLTIDLYESYSTPTTTATYTSDQIGAFSPNIAPNSSSAVCWNVTNCFPAVSPPGSFDMLGSFPNTAVNGAMNFDETYTLVFGTGSPVGSFVVIGQTSAIAVSAPAIAAVVDAASFSTSIAPGELATIFGSYLTDGAVQGATTIPLPEKLVDASVTVNGTVVPLLYAGPSQINFQIPYEAPAGSTAQVVVTTKTGISNSFPIPLKSTAPSVFVYNGTHAVAQNSDVSLNQTTNGAMPGSYITAYATGGGTVSNQPADGAVGPSSPLASVPSGTASATIDGENAPVLFAGLAPGFVGLLQVNITVPADLAAGSYPLVITIAGAQSKPTTVDVQ